MMWHTIQDDKKNNVIITTLIENPGVILEFRYSYIIIYPLEDCDKPLA